MFEYFFKSVEKLQVKLKSGKNNGHVTWRPVYIFDFCLESEVLQTAVEKIETRFVYAIMFVFENSAVYGTMWENIVQPNRSQLTI